MFTKYSNMSAIKELIVFDIILHFIEIIVRMSHKQIVYVQVENDKNEDPEEVIEGSNRDSEVEEDYPEEDTPEEVEEEISQE